MAGEPWIDRTGALLRGSHRYRIARSQGRNARTNSPAAI